MSKIPPITAAQMKILSSLIIDCIPTDVSTVTAQYWIDSPEVLKNQIRILFIPQTEDHTYAQERISWQRFYKKYFDWDLNFSDLQIHRKPHSIDKKHRYRLLVIVEALTLELIIKQYPCECKIIYDEIRWEDIRNQHTTYAVWVRDSSVPSSACSMRTPPQVHTGNVQTETLFERLIHGLKAYDETGKHIDTNSRTVCMGTSAVDSRWTFPSVCFRDKKLLVGLYNRAEFPRGTGVREVF